jgi:hypothetical protein
MVLKSSANPDATMTWCHRVTFLIACSCLWVSCYDSNNGKRDGDDLNEDDGGDINCDQPSIPVLLSPHNGEKVGTIRPVFTWISGQIEECPDGIAYEIEIDDSCEIPGFSDCGFSSAEFSESGISGERFALPVDLPASSTSPVGTRYFWRMRSCRESTCSPWSSARYFIAGKGWAIDFNLDGFSDVAVGADSNSPSSSSTGGKAYLFYGPITEDVIPGGYSLRLEDPEGMPDAHFGTSVAGGDFDGDGYTDLAMGAPAAGASGEGDGRLFVYRGSVSGLAGEPYVAIDCVLDQAGSGLGWSTASAGDVNGDGYEDLIAGAPFHDGEQEDQGYAAIFHGSSAGLGGEPATVLMSPESCWHGEFGRVVAPGGDINADGFSDIIVASHCLDAFGVGTGKTFVFYGSASGILSSTWDMISYEETLEYIYQKVANRHVGSAGDLNADGFSDVVVGAFWKNSILVYLGASEGLGLSSFTEIPGPGTQPSDAFGFSVTSLGDADGDGYADLLVGMPNRSPMAGNIEKGFIFRGNASGILGLPYAFASTYTFFWTSMFWATAVPGDLDGDGTADIVAGGPETSPGDYPCGFVFVFLTSGSGSVREPTLRIPAPEWDLVYPRFGSSIATGHYN